MPALFLCFFLLLPISAFSTLKLLAVDDEKIKKYIKKNFLNFINNKKR